MARTYRKETEERDGAMGWTTATKAARNPRIAADRKAADAAAIAEGIAEAADIGPVFASEADVAFARWLTGGLS